MLGKKGVMLKYLPNGFRDAASVEIFKSTNKSKKDCIAFAVGVVSYFVYGEGSASLQGGQASLHCSLFFPDRSASCCKLRESLEGGVCLESIRQSQAPLSICRRADWIAWTACDRQLTD